MLSLWLSAVNFGFANGYWDTSKKKIHLAISSMQIDREKALLGTSFRRVNMSFFLLAAIVLTSSCASMAPIENSDSSFYVPAKGDQKAACEPLDRPVGLQDSLDSIPSPLTLFSPGDRLNVWIEDGEEFNGDYVVEADGAIHLPYTPAVAAAGKSRHEVERILASFLVDEGLFRKDLLKLAVRAVQLGPIDVEVRGAVFNPGRVLVNQISADDKQDAVLDRFGDTPMERRVSSALRSAGGVRPDADLTQVRLVRSGVAFTLDIRGILSGSPSNDPFLAAGDQLELPSKDCFEAELVQPSSVTPDGIRVFMSNLTVPGRGNAPSAVGKFAQSMPYGSRLLHAAVSANCVGGSLASNARRHIVLISENRRDGTTEVVQYPIEALVRDGDRDQFNPYLMPDDAVACYDSAVTDVREVASTVLSILAPYGVARLAAGEI